MRPPCIWFPVFFVQHVAKWQMNTGSPGTGSALSGPGSALYLCSHWAGCAYATLQRVPRLKIVGSARSCELVLTTFFYTQFPCIQNWIVSKWIFQNWIEAMSKGFFWIKLRTFIFSKSIFLFDWIFLYSKLDYLKLDFPKLD